MSDQFGLFGDEPAGPDCRWCEKPIEKFGVDKKHWIHTDTRMSRCQLPGSSVRWAEPAEEEPPATVIPIERAHARNTDPVTSHEAAESIPSDKIRFSQEAVMDVFKRCGSMHDKMFISRYQHYQTAWALPKQSESGLRTRRSELVTKGRLVDSGEKVVLPDSNRRAIVWKVNDGP